MNEQPAEQKTGLLKAFQLGWDDARLTIGDNPYPKGSALAEAYDDGQAAFIEQRVGFSREDGDAGHYRKSRYVPSFRR